MVIESMCKKMQKSVIWEHLYTKSVISEAKEREVTGREPVKRGIKAPKTGF